MESPNVLIIDDEYDTCLLLSGFIKSRGINAYFANTIVDGLNMLKDRKFKLVFLDLNLPDGSGLNVISKIKEFDSSIKVIIISAYDGEMEKKRASMKGADDFVGKPLNRELINHILTSHLSL